MMSKLLMKLPPGRADYGSSGTPVYYRSIEYSTENRDDVGTIAGVLQESKKEEG
jgi:hypothetical protein